MRAQYIDGIYDNPVTLKCRLRVTQGHWKRKHWIDYLTLNIIVTLKCGSEVTQGHWKWYHLKAWGTVSYSPSIVTVAVSLAISDIFSVKEWPDLEIWVWGRSRSLKMVQFDMLLWRNYNCLVPFSRYLTLNNIVTLKSDLGGHSRSLKLVPFESLAAVCYSPSIVTMAVSVAVCKIFSIKEWCDLENQVRGRSRSLKMAPFDRPCTTFYWSAIVNIPLSRAIFELSDVE